MSMSVRLKNPEDEYHELTMSLPVDFQMPGSYYDDLRKYLGVNDGIGWLEGKPARDCLDRLWLAFQKAAAEIPGDQWQYSPGFYLMLLWSHARSNPDAVFITYY